MSYIYFTKGTFSGIPWQALKDLKANGDKLGVLEDFVIRCQEYMTEVMMMVDIQGETFHLEFGGYLTLEMYLRIRRELLLHKSES